MPMSNVDEVLLGEIRYFPYSYVPDGFLPCDGQILLIKDYQPLYALLEDRFGGTKDVTFQLPNLNKNLVDENCKYYIACKGNWPARTD